MLRILLLTILVILLLLLILPSMPAIQNIIYPIQPKPNPDYPVSYIPDETKIQGNETLKVYQTTGNRLYIPKIAVETEILEGETVDILNKKEGVWREPDTSNPDSGIQGNMVLAGHRFQYLPPNATTLYNLDKLSKDDEIQIYWEGKKHVYKISEIFEVFPDEVWIKNSKEGVSEITIYTCTPIYTSEKRLVVKAIEVI